MALEIIEQRDGKIIEVKIGEQLSREDYERFVPEAERLINQHGKLRALFDFREFQQWGSEVLWNKLVFDLGNLSNVERVAMIGPTAQQKWMASFGKVFDAAKIQYFEAGDLETADKWLGDLPIRMGSETPAKEAEKTDSPKKETEAPEKEVSENPAGKHTETWWKHWRRKGIIASILGLVAVFGLFVDRQSSMNTWWYWLLVLPVFGILGILSNFHEGKATRETLWPEIRKHLIHWLGYIIGLQLVYILIRTDALLDRDSALVSMLLLTLACYFAGLHLNNLYFLVATILVVVFISVVLFKFYIGLMILLLVIGIGCLVAYQKWFAKDPITGHFWKSKKAKKEGNGK